MIRTATNVTGDMMTAVVVGKSEGELNEEQFYSKQPIIDESDEDTQAKSCA